MVKTANNIVFKLVNTEKNEKLLKKVPHRTFFDMSIMYKSNNCIIDNTFNSTEEKLYNTAMDNIQKFCQVSISSLQERLEAIMPSAMAEMALCESELDEKPNVWYFSYNNTDDKGSTALLDLNCLKQVAQKANNNLYIFPYSLQECLAIGENENLQEWIEEISDLIKNDIKVKDRLSNQILYYNQETNEISFFSYLDKKRVKAGDDTK